VVADGKCGRAVDMNKADITIETRGNHPIRKLTLSLHVKLNHTNGLQPIVSAVNYNTQLRLEVQEGRLVWMFYNLGSSQGFIIQTQEQIHENRWTHILTDYDSVSGIGRIFIDGRVSNRESGSHVAFSQNWMLGLRFGKYFAGGLNYKMAGLMDELYFFDCVMTDELIEMMATHCDEFVCGKVHKNVAGYA